MIIKKCDICNNNVDELDTIILYKQYFDYCSNCKALVKRVAERYKSDINYILTQREQKYIDYLKARRNK